MLELTQKPQSKNYPPRYIVTFKPQECSLMGQELYIMDTWYIAVLIPQHISTVVSDLQIDAAPAHSDPKRKGVPGFQNIFSHPASFSLA